MMNQGPESLAFTDDNKPFSLKNRTASVDADQIIKKTSDDVHSKSIKKPKYYGKARKPYVQDKQKYVMH